MFSNKSSYQIIRQSGVMLAAATTLLLAGCLSEEDTTATRTTPTFLSLNLPNSMTGGVPTNSGSLSVARSFNAAAVVDQPCAYAGGDDQDPFRNGYEMTKLMVSGVAAWTCLADIIIDVSGTVPHDGNITPSDDNDMFAVGCDTSEPTHYSVTDDSDVQTTVRMYYMCGQQAEPTVNTAPGFYVSWVGADSEDVQGRMIIDGTKINTANRKVDDPTMMRMDFNYTTAAKTANMYLQFDANNEWADGFRIEVVKDLTANPLEAVYVARGLMNMKRQFLDVPGIPEIPSLQMYTVSDALGAGAAMAQFSNVAVDFPLMPTDFNNEALGGYVFTKDDKYFFKASGAWDYIYKTITSAEYRDGHTLTADTITAIQLHLQNAGLLTTGSELSNCIAAVDSVSNVDCVALLNAIFGDGFADQEQNQGSDPMDWRTTSIASPSYLGTVFPDGLADWTGAFDFSFTPTTPGGV